MRTIVVGVDGSGPSFSALRYAASLADDITDAEVVVVFARYAYVFMPPHVAEKMYVDMLDRAETIVEQEAERALQDREIRWKFVSREGEPAHVLRQVADELDASEIVVGRRGWSTAHELLVGSVSNRLVHRSERPVLLVPD